MYSCERSCSFIPATKIDKIKLSTDADFFYYIYIIYNLTARFIKFWILYLCTNIERRRLLWYWDQPSFMEFDSKSSTVTPSKAFVYHVWPLCSNLSTRQKTSYALKTPLFKHKSGQYGAGTLIIKIYPTFIMRNATWAFVGLKV